MVQFKCLHSGTVTAFEHEWDILQMRSHPDYEEVKEEVKPVAEKPVKKTAVKTEE